MNHWDREGDDAANSPPQDVDNEFDDSSWDDDDPPWTELDQAPDDDGVIDLASDEIADDLNEDLDWDDEELDSQRDYDDERWRRYRDDDEDEHY